MGDLKRGELKCAVLVAGGGLVGATAALALARRGLSVVLADRGEPPLTRGRLGFDVRTVALNPASVELLTELDVWRAFAPCPFDRVHVCEERGTRHIEFLASEIDRSELGWIVEVSPSVAALWTALRRQSDLTIVTGAIESVTAQPDAVRARIGDVDVTAELLIAADGANSSIRTQLGVDAGRFETASSGDRDRRRDRARSRGLRVAVLHARRTARVVAVAGARRSSFRVRRLVAERGGRRAIDGARRRRTSRRASNKRATARLGAIRAVDQRFSFPLEQLVASSFQPAPRVLLVGDAARVLHPLAGQGVNLGFEDIREVVRVAGRVAPAALGDAELWQGFARRRRLRAELMVRAMDAFAFAYKLADPTVNWLRNAAVDLLNNTPPLKRQLLREALGFGIFAPPR